VRGPYYRLRRGLRTKALCMSYQSSLMFGLGYVKEVSLFICLFNLVLENISYDYEVPRCLCNVGDNCWPKNRVLVLRILRLPTMI
jgi:hypothetical protein